MHKASEANLVAAWPDFWLIACHTLLESQTFWSVYSSRRAPAPLSTARTTPARLLCLAQIQHSTDSIQYFVSLFDSVNHPLLFLHAHVVNNATATEIVCSIFLAFCYFSPHMWYKNDIATNFYWWPSKSWVLK